MALASWAETLFTNRADFTALASFTSEASLIAGLNLQPSFRAGYFTDPGGFGKCIDVTAMGVLSSTGTPTYTFTARVGSTQGTSNLTGTAAAVSAALTTQSGVTNAWWKLWLRLVCNTPGEGSGNLTLSGAGLVMSPGGLASPFIYPLEPTTPNTATWTATIDGSVKNYLNLSVACSASSSSNTITCKHLSVLGLN